MKTRQPDVDIEINYDAELEEFGSETDAGDARFVRVRVKNRNIVPGSLELEPPDPVDQTTGEFLACPVQIRAGTQDYTELYEGRDRTARFRAELDLPSIMLAWTTVQEAAKEPRRFCIKVALEANQRYPKEDCIRYGRVKINVNTIRWTWTPLIRDREGTPAVENGDAQDNTPIEVNVDGTDKNGFRLEVERGVLRPDGEYEAAKSDFTHYLSPDGKVNKDILFLAPEPWDSAIQPTQQIVTNWWTKNLPVDHPLLNNLPMETSIRVQAFKENSIEKRAPGIYLPKGLPILAIREIPLQLGLRTWTARLVTPDPNEPPVLLDTQRPWEDGFEVEVEIRDDSNPDDPHYLKNAEIQWKLLSGPDGRMPGGVQEGNAKDQSKGVWKTDGDGHLKFRFCPKKENSLFLYQQNGVTFRAEFDLYQKGSSEDKPGPKIRSHENSDNERAPSFSLDWAPKFDLAIFKLPFFIAPDATLNLEPDQSEENVKPVAVSLTPEDMEPEEAIQQTDAYRSIFRTGGTITLQPIVPWGDVVQSNVKCPLKDFRLLVGGQTGEKPRKVRVIPGDEGIWPGTVTVPTPPDQSGGESLALNPHIELHPDIKAILTNIIDESTTLNEGCSASAALHDGLEHDAETDFNELGQNFTSAAVEFFAETLQTDLVRTAKALYNTLIQMPPFLGETLQAWKRLGSSIIFHRQAYKRFEDDLISFYYDVVQWGPAKELAKNAWAYCKGTALGQWIESWGGLTLGPTRIGSLMRDGNEKIQSFVFRWYAGTFKTPVDAGLARLKDELNACWTSLEMLTGRRSTLLEGLTAARSRFKDAVDNFAAHSDEFLACANEIQDFASASRAAGKSEQEVMDALRGMGLVGRLEAATSAFQQARSELRAQLGGGGGPSYARVTREAMVVESQYVYWTARKQSLQEVSNHFEEGSKALGEFVAPAPGLFGVKKLDEKALEAVLQKFDRGPESLRTVVPSLQQAGEEFLSGKRDDFLAHAGIVLGKVRALQQYRAKLDLRAVGPNVKVGGGQDWQAAFDDLQSFESEISQYSTATQEFSETAKGFMGQRLQNVFGVWQAEKMLVDQYAKDALKKGQARGTKELRETMDGGPGAPPQGSEGLLDEAWDLFKSLLSKIDWAFNNIPSTILFRTVSALAWGLRLVLIPFNFFFRLCERLLAKFFEFCIFLYDWLLTTEAARQAVSCLNPKAITEGDQAFSNGVGGLGDFFDLPYDRALGHLKMMRDAKEKFYADTEDFDTSLDDALKNGLATGFEDYYPSQLVQARGLLYGLCHRVLHEDKRMLVNPPCQEDCRPIGRVAGTAAETIGGYIDAFLAAGDMSASKKGILPDFKPFWNLAADALSGSTGMNTRKLEAICDWVGWLIAWGLRIAAFLMAVCIFFALIPEFAAGFVAAAGGYVASALGVETVTVGTLLTTASSVSAISAIFKAFLTALGFYPYSVAYPRDVLLVHGVYFAMVFKPPGERFEAASASDILKQA
jgi:hypothetical protein